LFESYDGLDTEKTAIHSLRLFEREAWRYEKEQERRPTVATTRRSSSTDKIGFRRTVIEE
jgi:hypothetical protein